jgi:hypothetical protein
VRIVDIADGKPVYEPVKSGINWNEWSAWAMRFIQTVLIGLAAKWGFQADSNADVAAVNSRQAIVKANQIDEKVDAEIEQGRENHRAIRETQSDVKTVRDKVAPTKKSP